MERIFLDEAVGEVESYRERFAKRVGIPVERYLHLESPGVEDEEQAFKLLPAIDCLVLGYVPEIDKHGEVIDIQSFALAAEVNGKLRYVGMVDVAKLPVEERGESLGFVLTCVGHAEGSAGRRSMT